MLLTDKYADKIYGTITCYNRMNIDQLIDRTINNLYRVIANYAEISKNVSATKKIHKTLEALRTQQNQAFTEVF